MKADRTPAFLAAALLALAAPFAAAQDYPAREIRSLCNYAPGSGADLIVRFYSDRLSKLAGRPVIVENRVGANGMIASDALAKSRPDGYTIMITPASSTIAAAPYLFKNLPFDTAKDFAAVATIASLSSDLKSRPDGYTIMITPASSTIAAAPYLFKNLPFDTAKDFAAVATIASLSFVIA